MYTNSSLSCIAVCVFTAVSDIFESPNFSVSHPCMRICHTSLIQFHCFCWLHLSLFCCAVLCLPFWYNFMYLFSSCMHFLLRCICCRCSTTCIIFFLFDIWFWAHSSAPVGQNVSHRSSGHHKVSMMLFCHHFEPSLIWPQTALPIHMHHHHVAANCSVHFASCNETCIIILLPVCEGERCERSGIWDLCFRVKISLIWGSMLSKS
jgi:hypothetical protein